MKKIIITFISVVIILFISRIYMVVNNNNYTKDLEHEILNNYKLEQEIKYLNKTNLYYIILTNKNLIVLDDKFNEIKKEDVNKIKQKNKDYEIVYRLNKVMYEKKIIKKQKVVYEYYDIYTNELIDTLEVGG